MDSASLQTELDAFMADLVTFEADILALTNPKGPADFAARTRETMFRAYAQKVFGNAAADAAQTEEIYVALSKRKFEDSMNAMIEGIKQSSIAVNILGAKHREIESTAGALGRATGRKYRETLETYVQKIKKDGVKVAKDIDVIEVLKGEKLPDARDRLADALTAGLAKIEPCRLLEKSRENIAGMAVHFNVMAKISLNAAEIELGYMGASVVCRNTPLDERRGKIALCAFQYARKDAKHYAQESSRRIVRLKHKTNDIFIHA